MTTSHLQLTKTVQLNCNISDARFAGNYTLCVYLLKMREYYRWEQKHTFSEELSNDAIGDWLTQREELWDEIENHEYSKINTDGKSFDPFDSTAINEQLVEHGLVYSAGIGQKSKPHFFIADLDRSEKLNGYNIYVSSREYARDLTSPPAMSHDHSIFIRRESFKRMIWEKTEEWRWNKPDNAMKKAMDCYDFENKLEDSLNRMTDCELEVAVLHEVGEIEAGEFLDGWQEMMQDLFFTKAEIMTRAVRDHLADSISTLPTLLRNNNTASVHFYIANLTNMRKHIFPSLITAYQNWVENDDLNLLQAIAERSEKHWKPIALKMIELHKEHGKNCHSLIEQLVETSHL